VWRWGVSDDRCLPDGNRPISAAAFSAGDEVFVGRWARIVCSTAFSTSAAVAACLRYEVSTQSKRDFSRVNRSSKSGSIAVLIFTNICPKTYRKLINNYGVWFNRLRVFVQFRVRDRILVRELRFTVMVKGWGQGKRLGSVWWLWAGSFIYIYIVEQECEEHEMPAGSCILSIGKLSVVFGNHHNPR